MNMSPPVAPLVDLDSVTTFLAREAHAVDDQDWITWLDLFEESCEYWVPSWDSEHEPTSNPQTEVSLIYYNGRSGLEDRVFRLKTGRSAASTPMPRTCHMASNILFEPLPDGTCKVRSNWTTHVLRAGLTSVFYGRAEYVLTPNGSSWRIRRKKILLLNDVIPTVVDIYCL